LELLVVTLAQVISTQEAEALARMRIISDTVRNAPGLLNARFYRSTKPFLSYCLLTTWESEQWWQKAQERHAPGTLLLASPEGIFHTPPDQWLMHYLWGYSRPLAQPGVAMAYLAMIRPERAEQVQMEWLTSLQLQAIEPVLSFALLARSVENGDQAGLSSSDPAASRTSTRAHSRTSIQQGTLFFHLLSWPSEQYREDFYTNASYQQMQELLNRTGMVHVLALDPL
jgi:quinol monooxygenase YgiN